MERGQQNRAGFRFPDTYEFSMGHITLREWLFATYYEQQTKEYKCIKSAQPSIGDQYTLNKGSVPTYQHVFTLESSPILTLFLIAYKQTSLTTRPFSFRRRCHSNTFRTPSRECTQGNLEPEGNVPSDAHS